MRDRRYRMGAHSTYFKGGECRKQLRTDLFPLLCFFDHLSISASTHFSWWALLIDNELRITILFFANTTFVLKWNNTKSWKWWSKSFVGLSLGITMTFQYFCRVFGSFADFFRTSSFLTGLRPDWKSVERSGDFSFVGTFDFDLVLHIPCRG